MLASYQSHAVFGVHTQEQSEGLFDEIRVGLMSDPPGLHRDREWCATLLSMSPTGSTYRFLLQRAPDKTPLSNDRARPNNLRI
jgi:hypothetical protein